MKRWYLGVVMAAVGVAACGSPAPVEEAIPEPEPMVVEPADSAGTVVRVDPAFDALVPADAVIEKLADGYGFTEGPVWVRRGDPDPYLLFSDIPNNVIRKWSPTEGASDFLSPVFEGDPDGRSVGSNGLLIDSEGRLILCEHGNRRISRIELDGSVTVLVDSYEGKRLNSPNDAVYHSSGALYFTDPPYGLREGNDDPDKELDFNGIFRLSPDGTLTRLADQTAPNGI